MWRLVPALVREMGDAFGELQRAESLIKETLKLEETRFKETLGRGLRQLEDATAPLGDGEDLPGAAAARQRPSGSQSQPEQQRPLSPFRPQSLPKHRP